MSTQRTLGTGKAFWIAAVGLLLITGLGLGLFVHAYRGVLQHAFEERSTAYVQAFAAAAGPWAEQGGYAMLQAASRFLLVGSALFVQVEAGGSLIVDERTSTTEGIDLSRSVDGTAGARTPAVLPSGVPYLDIAVPLMAANSDGFVRVGIDRMSVALQTRYAALVGGGVGLAFDLAILLLLAWVLRSRAHIHASQSPSTEADLEAMPLVCGSLVIDRRRKVVQLDEKSVRATPKQFALLELLASKPGQVFSEKEILAVAWPESAYADSKDIKQYVYLLRRRLAEVRPEARDLIVTVPGFGYKLTDRPINRSTDRPIDQELTGNG